MKINYANKTITLTKSEMKAAQTYGTDAYKALVDARRTFPDFIVVVKTPASKRDNFKGLTRDFMKGYILEHDDEEHSVMAEFNALCGFDDNGEVREGPLRVHQRFVRIGSIGLSGFQLALGQGDGLLRIVDFHDNLLFSW